MLLLQLMKDAHEHLKKPQLAKLSPMAKLIWLYIATAGEGEYSVRTIERDLGVSFLSAYNNLTALIEQGLLLEIIPAAGPKAATLRALEPK